jgi:lysophospholipase L1-like esterase
VTTETDEARPAGALPARRRPRRRVVVIGLLIVFVAGLLFAEGVARLAWKYEGAVREQLAVTGLDDWEVPAESGENHWYLRRDFTYTLGDSIEAKRRQGRDLSVAELEKRLTRESADTVYLRVNRDGYRGPELDPTHSRPRIVMNGDSVTFGIVAGEDVPYPRVVERTLAARGVPVEVVNAGVEGYGIPNVLRRTDELAALKPEIVTALIGWNDMMGQPRPGPSYIRWLEDRFYAFRAIRRLPRIYRQVVHGEEFGNWMLAPRVADLQGNDLADANHFRPERIGLVREFVLKMQAAGAKPVIFTLPGLYVMDQEPTERAMSFGFVTPWSTNPYVLARMTEIYNDELRALGRETGATVIDLDAWSRDALQPRDRYFFDSVHLTDEGLRLMGEHIATELEPLLPARR